MPVQDNETKGGIFPGKVIIVEHGKQAQGGGMPKIWKKYIFKETCAIMPSMRGFCSKNKNFRGFFPGKEVPQPFLTAAANPAA